VAPCQQDAGLAQLAGELHSTIDVVRRRIDEAGIHCSSPKVRSARQRRLATNQRLTEPVGQLGFANLGAYLADRVTKRAWTLPQVASELGIHRDTGWTTTGCTAPRRPHGSRPTLAGVADRSAVYNGVRTC
jgi:hypothetical protein